MAIAFDKEGHNNTGDDTVTTSLAAAAANELAIIFVDWNTALGATFNALTVNGSATGVTQFGTEYATATNRMGRTYYLVNPPTSSVAYTLTVNATGNGTTIGVLLYSGTDQTSPIDSHNTQTGTGTSVTLSTTVVASDCWLVSGMGAWSGGLAASTGTTLRYDIAAAGVSDGGDSNGTVSTGSQSMAWTFNSGTYGGRILSIAPPGTPAAAGRPNFLTLLGVS